MDGRINVAEAPEFMVSRRPPNPVEKANPAWIPGPNSPLENTPHKAGVEGDGAMSALRTLIDVPAERCGAAAHDGGEDLQVQPGKPFPAAIQKSVSSRADEVGHLQRRPGHLFDVSRVWVAGVDR